MKIATRCLGCGNVVRWHGSFTVKLRETKILPPTETKWGGGGSGPLKYEQEFVGRLCRRCALNAGYKVKGSIEKQN